MKHGPEIREAAWRFMEWRKRRQEDRARRKRESAAMSAVRASSRYVNMIGIKVVGTGADHAMMDDARDW